MASGHPDFSGYWKGTRDTVPGGNIGKDLPGLKLPLTPAGEAALQHNLTATIDPEALCIIGGIPRHNASGLPFEVLQGANKIAFLYFYSYFRLIPIDGRKHTDDPDPSFFGEEVGKWEGDTLVIDSIGFKDEKVWIDENANPHSDALHVVERWTRPDMDHIHVDTLIEDPKFYTRPFTYARTWVLGKPDEQTAGVLLQREQRGPRSPGLRSGSDSSRRHARLHRPGAAAAAADSERPGEKVARARCVVFQPPRVLGAVRRAGARSARPASPLRMRRAAAGALRPGGRPLVAARQPAAIASRRCGGTASCCRCSPASRRSRSAKASRRSFTHARSAPRSASTACTSRTSRSTRPTRSRRAGSRRRSRGRRPRRDDGRRCRSAGNAGNAMAAYAARGRAARARSFIPRDVKRPFARECQLYGADVTLVDGLITDAGRVAAEQRRAARLVRRLDAQGAVPHRRQEDDGLRARRADGLALARLDHLSDRRRHRAWSACGRRSTRWSAIGWMQPAAPAAHGVGAGRGLRADRPRVHRGHREGARCGKAPRTVADGLRVPRAIGDFLILRAVRESGGTALAVSDTAMVDGMLAIGAAEGVSAAPEGGAALAAMQRARRTTAPSSRTTPSCCSTPAAR